MRDFPDPCMTQCYQCIFYTVLFITTTYGLELAQAPGPQLPSTLELGFKG
jgi:hypothetical protein